ncbi:MAG TPA: FAD-binding and (Fe-S)-binding domain-containing protein [Ilumatobacter sp.]|nr:FAD-binding and (Fe-S)-binding domain-containing protein [Ilumatobacter sp.]
MAAGPDQLIARLRGTDSDVAADLATRAAYSGDASNYRHVPQVVVRPRSTRALGDAVAACGAAGVASVVRGGGTSIAGNAITDGVLIDVSRYLTRVLQVDADRRRARVEPGVVLDRLQDVAGTHGLRFGPDPSTHSRCTIGGMIGNNACGSRSLAWGRTIDNVEQLTVALSDGTCLVLGAATAAVAPADPNDRPARARAERIRAELSELVDTHADLIRTHQPATLRRRSSGYALDQLLPEHGFHVARSVVGSEGSCVTVLEAELTLVTRPAVTGLVAVGFPSVIAAADAVPAWLDLELLALEGLDEHIVANVERAGRSGRALLPPGAGWLLIEVGGDDPAEVAERTRDVLARVPATAQATTLGDPTRRAAVWRVREDGAGLATRLPDGREAWPGWEDAAVPPERLGDYLRDLTQLMQAHHLQAAVYGHFGEGCLHARIDFPLQNEPRSGSFRAFMEAAADIVGAYGGSLSGEHGDGQARSELLDRMYPPAMLDLFTRFKRIWEPTGTLGAGAIVSPRPIDADLRAARRPIPVTPVFAYPHDDGDLNLALRRCVGVGRCRDDRSGTMCPSYMATHDELHSTRGRARVLHEMLTGGLDGKGFGSAAAAEALDLCLGCKACRSECPVEVDIATYKAEFLHHHYRHRLRPRHHYSMGWLPMWLRAASIAPGLANGLMRRRAVRALAGLLGGIEPRRAIPSLATPHLRRRDAYGRARTAARATRPVLLWPDSFTAAFSPQVWEAAAAVIASAGFTPVVPPGRLCCGITWISTGQLDHARRVLQRTLTAIAPHLDDLDAIVVLEPSCATTLRDDLPELLADDPRAHLVAARIRTFAEWVDAHSDDLPLRPLDRPSTSQVHCHQRASVGTAADRRVKQRLGLDDHELDSGCCGLAGDFGFVDGHYDVSVACAERVLLPSVRALPDGATVLADGFSCRVQIEQLAGVPGRHLAELVHEALPPRDA